MAHGFKWRWRPVSVGTLFYTTRQELKGCRIARTAERYGPGLGPKNKQEETEKTERKRKAGIEFSAVYLHFLFSPLPPLPPVSRFASCYPACLVGADHRQWPVKHRQTNHLGPRDV